MPQPYETPAPPVNIAEAIPQLASCARTTVRLHPRRGRAPIDASKIGGMVVWPEHEEWPMCPEHDCPFVPAIQLRKDDVPEIAFRRGSNLFQVLRCPNLHGNFVRPTARVFWRSFRRVRKRRHRCPKPTKVEQGYVVEPCTLHPERIVEFPDSAELSDELVELIERSEEVSHALSDSGVEAVGHWDVPKDILGLYCVWLSVAPGTKVGGHPAWIHDEEIPNCRCGQEMEFVMQFADCEFDGVNWGRWLPEKERGVLRAPYQERTLIQSPANWNIGGMGYVYLFICRQCDDWPIQVVKHS